MKFLLITPPLLQCNAPYAATPFLTAYLRSRGHDAVQADASLEVVLRLFSRRGLERIREAISGNTSPGRAGNHFLEHFDAYTAVIDPVIAFLQGKDSSPAHRIVTGDLLPHGPRFETMLRQETDEQGTLAWAFGEMGTTDQARYRAGLMIDDLVWVIREQLDPAFGLSRYGERLSVLLPSFEPLLERLSAEPTLVDRVIDEVADELSQRHRPELIGFTVPFPGTLYGALRMARSMRRADTLPRIVLGGGYISTELRELSDPRLFDFVDYVCLDEGLAALESIARRAGGTPGDSLPPRTFVRRGGVVVCGPADEEEAPSRNDHPAPVYDGLVLDRYVPVAEMLNPMHVLWSGGYWNRLMLVHGCYWHRCRFCDTSLDYIRRYEPVPASRQVDWIEEVVAATGRRGFHFVDEALSPAVLRALSHELLRREMVITWWGNIRFEKGIKPALAGLMAHSGCIAVTGGLEAPDDRLLKVMNKGCTVAGATRVCAALSAQGIMVHAYLMYGLPTQTEQETIDCLERVRQLFEAGFIHSAFWHRFAATVHSDIGRHPEDYTITLQPSDQSGFARNGIPFTDTTKVDHEALGRGLNTALYNYMHGVGLERDVREWFDTPVPASRVGPDEIEGFVR
jgi:radical SAM superfamily enzyme YgiQ (UPF0313 family)